MYFLVMSLKVIKDNDNEVRLEVPGFGAAGGQGLAGHSLEDGDEQVEQQDVGKKQITTQQNDGEPLRECWGVVIIQNRALGLQWVSRIHSALAHVKVHICTKRITAV